MPTGPKPSENLIRITHADANSEHVESLLRRQMSLRGERGITAVKTRRWYYQSWFILMLAAGLMSFTAWAIIEPFYDDNLYVQGPIAHTQFTETLERKFVSDDQQMEFRVPSQGLMRIGDQEIWITDKAKFWINGKAEPFDRAALTEGKEVGVYLEPVDMGRDILAFAMFIDPLPPAQTGTKPAVGLSQVSAQHAAAGLLMFPLVAGLIGLGVGAVDGIVCRLLRRALFAGAVGLLIGFLGGFVSSIIAGLAYAPLSDLAMRQSDPGTGHLTPFAFFVQLTGRGLAWMLAGVAMGLGQGIALRSRRLLVYGLVGGVIGGLLGGLLFDPIDILLLGMDKPSAHIARMVGFTVIGLFVGAMIGVVELLARDAWLRMTEGPLTGKEFLLFKDTIRIGASSRSDIYLFNDPQVAAQHAMIRSVGDHSEIESTGSDATVMVNARPVRHARLRHGDQITIGRTSFVFQSRRG